MAYFTTYLQTRYVKCNLYSILVHTKCYSPFSLLPPFHSLHFILPPLNSPSITFSLHFIPSITFSLTLHSHPFHFIPWHRYSLYTLNTLYTLYLHTIHTIHPPRYTLESGSTTNLGAASTVSRQARYTLYIHYIDTI